MFSCDQCGKTFSFKRNLSRHVRASHEDALNACHLCGARFGRQDHLSRHLKTCKPMGKRSTSFNQFEEGQCPAKKRRMDEQMGGGSPFTCEKCTTTFTEKKNLIRHKRNVHQDICDLEDLQKSDARIESALQRTVCQVDLPINDRQLNLDITLENLRPDILEEIQKGVGERRGIKWQLVVHVRFVRPSNWINDKILETTAFFRSKTSTALQGTDIDLNISQAVSKILECSQTFLREGSGWKFDSVLGVKLCLAVYEPLAASSFIPLPKKLLDTRSIINIQNEDRKCFLWSVLAALHPVEEHANRVSKYMKFEDSLDITGLDFPVPITQVKKFAARNNLSINVYGYEQEIYPLHIEENSKSRHVDLLLLSSEENQHYCLITNMSRLLSHLTKHNGARYYCPKCLHRYSREDLLENHIKLCRDHDAQKIELPTEQENVMKFTNTKKQVKVPFIVYADFETFAEKIHGPRPSSSVSSTTATTHQVPCGFCLVVIGPDGLFFQQPITYHGKNAVDIFFEKLMEIQGKITPILKNNKEIVITEQEEDEFMTASHCHICSKPFKNEKPVRDHDHYTGLYRGAAHNLCNIQYQVCGFIPVVFHNLRTFDGHLLMQGIGKIKNQKISCIANNMEKYISFSLGNLRFIDSLQFLSASLDSLVQNLSLSGMDAFHCVKQYFPIDKLQLLLRKGVFPYDFLDSEECFNVTELPPSEAFYNKLTEEVISEADYQHAQRVWSAFEMQNFGQYHDLYVTLDTLLLADVFENFRRECIQYYRLDPAQYYTVPGLAWDACLLTTGVELDLFMDPDMYLFIEKGIRGGISMISNRFSKANNPYIEGYDRTEPTTYISYIDMNNLYGCSMIDFLPVGDFKWMLDVSDFNIMEIGDDSPIGYILEVDLEYPEGLHDLHNCFPLAPQRMKISEEMLSPYSRELLKTLGIKHMDSVEKLVPNFLPKNNYVLHYRNLKLYLSLGLKLKKIHRIIQFHQRPWLREYIQFNTERRKEAKTEFSKNLFKLLNNAVFGKSMEDPRKHIDVQLVQTSKQMKKLVAKPTYKSCRIFSEDLVGVEMQKTTLKLNKPIYTGLTILDLSKALMYDFHYNHMLKKYGSRVKLNFTDTDSFCYTIQTEDLYKDMADDSHLYDTSDYPVDHFLHSSVNKKVLGKFKDEVSGGFIEEFVGLRPKCYSIKTTIGEKKTAKGVGKSAARRDLHHEKYKSSLLDKKVILAEMNRIQCVNHELYTVAIRKIGLSPADDKRYILEDGISTLAHGHCKIRT